MEGINKSALLTAKIFLFFLIIIATIYVKEIKTYAASGEMFYFGGITEGSKLPKTIDSVIKSKSSSNGQTYTYKEVVALNGEVKIAECDMSIKTSGTVKGESGSYTVTYDIKSKAGSEVALNRNIALNVKYRIVDNQTVKDYTISKWTETIQIGEEEIYTLDEKQSTLNLPTIEYEAPAITYFKTVISNELVYINSTGDKVVVTHTGQSFGYNTHWSSVETENIEARIEKFNSLGEGQLGYEKEPSMTMILNLKPSVKMHKTLTYDVNTPYAIAFDGNYLEVISNSGGLVYEIVKAPLGTTLKLNEMKGTISLPTFNEQEILIAPKNIQIWNGNFAEEDIKKLFSMEILEGDTKYYVPNQALTRSQFVRMIVKALGYEPYTDKKELAIFEDVDQSHVNYGYVIKAWQEGIVMGTGDAHFNPDQTINRQEAFAIYMRALGLSNKANYNTSITPFIDDNEIDLWAKRDILALFNLGLVKGDSGYVKPKSKISKAEGAALVNRMVDYLREGIEEDYVENLINY
ncbi:MAG: S-layer homology domain-containing protein [Clostridia bacterium]|nr:S-layer homology domain-containing protein [Clostridia bacterium]